MSNWVWENLEKPVLMFCLISKLDLPRLVGKESVHPACRWERHRRHPTKSGGFQELKEAECFYQLR